MNPINITDKDPVWARLLALCIPEARMLIAIGYFVLGFRVLYMIERTPQLLANAAFMTVVTLIVGTGGLGIVGAFFFGGTKSGAETMTAQTKTIAAATSSEVK